MDEPICVIKLLPEEDWAAAAKEALAINPANAPSPSALRLAGPGVMDEPQRLALETTKYWGAGGVRLTVGFLDGSPADLRARILQHMNAWSQWANVTFVETGTNPQVRIATSPGGFWSYVGTDILGVAAHLPTMNLEGFTMDTPESKFVRVVRHETGHTLGFPHEHLRKEIVERIDPELAIEYFARTNRWDPDKVRRNVLTPLSTSAILATAEVDPNSIMCYWLPASIMKDGVAVAGGRDIDTLDAQFAGQLYPLTGRLFVADFSKGAPPAEVRLWEKGGPNNGFGGWFDGNDLQFVGDFTGVGHDQLLCFNQTNTNNDGRITVLDFAGSADERTRYWENWGQSNLFNGWLDGNDLQFAGDFLGLGHDQVLCINQTNTNNDGRILIADFAASAENRTRHWENWGPGNGFGGWFDGNDLQFVGDFTGVGHDQLLCFNQTNTNNDGRITVLDFAGSADERTRYWENWGQSNLFNGWLDGNDLQFAGDFLGLGHDQILCINQTNTNNDGRILIADFAASAENRTRHWENWGPDNGFGGWFDGNDLQFVGDFMGLGHDQLLCINQTNTNNDGRVMVIDFAAPVAERTRYWENWGQNTLFNGWMDGNDLHFAGDFMALHHSQLFSINNAQ